jgi:hypothetical protein
MIAFYGISSKKKYAQRNEKEDIIFIKIKNFSQININ